MGIILKPVRNRGGAKSSATRLELYLAEGLSDDKSLANYLEYGHEAQASRVRAFTSWNGSETPFGWAKDFAKTRAGYKKEDGRKYYHFVFSPDPEDKASPSEVADMAAEWVELAFPGSQWVAAVHDDNAGHIPHAHIVVNAVYPDTGRKIHYNDSEWNDKSILKNQVALAHGLSKTETVYEHRRNELWESKRARADKAEEAILRRGGRSWKHEIKIDIDVAMTRCSTWGEFVEDLNKKGIKITRERRGGGLVFWHPQSNGYDKKVRAAKLGGKYTEAALTSRMGFDFKRLSLGREVLQEIDPKIKQAVFNSYPRNDRSLQTWLYRIAGRYGNDVADTIRDANTCATFGIDSVRKLDYQLQVARNTHERLAQGYIDAERALAKAQQLNTDAQTEVMLASKLTCLTKEANKALFVSPKKRNEIKATRERLGEVRARLENVAGVTLEKRGGDYRASTSELLRSVEYELRQTGYAQERADSWLKTLERLSKRVHSGDEGGFKRPKRDFSSVTPTKPKVRHYKSTDELIRANAWRGEKLSTAAAALERAYAEVDRIEAMKVAAKQERESRKLGITVKPDQKINIQRRSNKR